MKIEVLGSGCPTCKKLHELTKKVVKELDLDAAVEYSDDVQKIVETGVLSSPVLLVDGKVVLAGSVPSASKLKEVISSAREEIPLSCDCAHCHHKCY